MIHVFRYRQDRGVAAPIPADEIDQLLAAPGELLWIDATAPSSAELERLRSELNLHPLALEDLTHRSDRPRIEQFDGLYAIVFYAIGVPVGGDLECLQINLLVARNYLLTVHETPIPVLEEVIRRWQVNAERMDPDVGIPVYSLLDTLVDGYFPCVDEITERVEAMEDQVFQGLNQEAIQAIFHLKKDLLRFRRIVAPERDVINVLLRREQPIFSERSLIYFQDIYDHLVRITDSIDTYRDLLSSAMDAYLSVASNRLAENSIKLAEGANQLNKTMQALTSWSIILMSASLIAGIYGMNFRIMPELGLRYGYFGALGTMLVLGVGLLIVFKRKGWL
jgi:magnesium transporter